MAFISFLTNVWRTLVPRGPGTRNAAAIVAQLGDELRPGEPVNSRCSAFDVSNLKGTPTQLRGRVFWSRGREGQTATPEPSHLGYVDGLPVEGGKVPSFGYAG